MKTNQTFLNIEGARGGPKVQVGAGSGGLTTLTGDSTGI